VVNCHCGQCRKWHGHYAAYTAAPRQNVSISGESRLSWYVSSKIARRGFCAFCGSSLFWQPFDEREISIAAGSLDEPTGLETVRHIFVADKGDYYEITDDLEQLPGTQRGGGSGAG
jgi:hypothetical protein